MKKLFLTLFFILASISFTHAYTINFSACDTTGQAFVWDQSNSYGECVDLTTLYYMISNVSAVNTADTTTYPLLVESATGNQAPKTSTSFYYNANTGALNVPSMTLSPSATPSMTFYDSDGADANDKESANIYSNMTTTTATAEDAGLYFQVKADGAERTFMSAVASTGSDSTMPTVRFSGRRLPITSSIDRAIAQTEVYDGRFISTHTSGTVRFTLFGSVAAAGYSGCFYASTAYAVYVDVHSDDHFYIPDSGAMTNGQALYSDGSIGEFMCVESIASGIWLVTSRSNGWLAE